jgi:GT2 family glycosyltransferase
MWVFGAALAAAVWLVTDLALTKDALEDSREEAAKYERIVEVQGRIDERDEVIIRRSRDATEAIMEAPNADMPIPLDDAIAWAAGIDSLRDDAGTPDKYDVPRPAARETKRSGADAG